MAIHSKHKLILGIVFLALLIGGSVAWALFSPSPDEIEGVPSDGWKTVTYESGLIFRYPEQLTTMYIQPVDWPPQVQVVAGPFTCTEAGEETERAGKTERRRVDHREYCVTKVTEGAAGSVYTLYTYATPTGSGNKVIILTFSLRATQCGNYDAVEMRACEGERETFDIDGLAHRIIETI